MANVDAIGKQQQEEEEKAFYVTMVVYNSGNEDITPLDIRREYTPPKKEKRIGINKKEVTGGRK